MFAAIKQTSIFERWLTGIFKDGTQAEQVITDSTFIRILTRRQSTADVVEAEVAEESKEEEIDPSTLSEADRIRYNYRKHQRELKKKEREQQEAEAQKKKKQARQSQAAISPQHTSVVFKNFIGIVRLRA